MPKTLLTITSIVLCAQISWGATIDGVTATLAPEVDAPKNSWTATGLSTSYTVPTGGADVLVFCAFSTKTPTDATPQTRTGNWRLSDGSSTSLDIERFLERGGNDSGVASVVNIFSCASGYQTFSLEHQTINTIGNKLAQSYNMSMVALPLKTSDGITLAHAQDTTGSYDFPTTSSSFVIVNKAASTELKAAVTLPAAAGKIMVICSYNSASGEVDPTNKNGAWELHIRKSGETTTTKVGEEMLRHINESLKKPDVGACTIIGIADSWDGDPLEASTTYDILLKVKTDNGNLITKNVTLTAVALSYMDAESTPAPHTFPARQSTISDATSTTTASWQDSGLYFTHRLPSTAKIFLASSYVCKSGVTLTNTARNGEFRFADNNSSSFYSMPVKRYLSGSGDLGSAGNVGLTPSYSASSKTCELQYQPVEAGYDIALKNPVMASVLLTSESSPATQANYVYFYTVEDASMYVLWDNGDGLGRLVVCRAGAAPSSGPVDGTTYSAGSTFGSGSALGDGYVVYLGTGDAVAVDGLSANTEYYFQVYEYNYSGSYTDYTTTTNVFNPGSETTIPEPGVIGLLLIMATAFIRQRLN